MAAWLELVVFLGVLTLVTPALGGYMAAVFEGPDPAARRIGGRFERLVYRMCRIDEQHEMGWREYLAAAVIFSGVSALALLLILLVQFALPLNPQHFASLPPLLALNVAISFMTTTNWQAYSGESALSYLSQMSLGWQNFVAAAVGLAVAIAAIRGFTRSSHATLGNFWVDLTRSAALSTAVATGTSSGAANLAYDSLMPLSGLIALLNMQIGEVIFGGVGSGLYGMILLAILTVFIAGLMVGRTPEYLGKKIEQREITLVVIAALIPAATMLVPTALALAPGLSATGNAGPHGFTEILYAFTSVSANNGSSMGGLNVQTDFYDILTGAVMLLGRFGTMIVILALAGGLVAKVRNTTASSGTIDTTTPLFGGLLAATALIVTALTFVPADALGPIAEQLLLRTGATF
ncbi:MAG: potassium-transporting ATPase subunit KdpA [Candidatus Velthaea sp.]|jgi:K+-transporting ATPase A subunit